jgi:hypothetical protein
MSTPSMDRSWKGTKHLVPPRNEGRLLLRVDVIPQNGMDVGGQYVPHGTHNVVIYRDQLDEVRALVQTEDAKRAFQMASETYAAQLAELIKDIPLGVEGDRAREFKISRHPESIYSILAVDPRYKGGLGPLMSLEVIEDVPAPPTIENLQANGNATLAEAITRAVAAGAGGAPTPEQIDARIQAGIAAGLAALEERIAAKYRTK